MGQGWPTHIKCHCVLSSANFRAICSVKQGYVLDELYELKGHYVAPVMMYRHMSFTDTQESQRKVLSFDPGATTGVALIDAKGGILRTEAFMPSEVLAYARRMAVRRESFHPPDNFSVVIEKGPEWQQHSPITRSVEVKLREIFPDADLVTPNRWKGSPKARCGEKVGTRHEKDAVRLARWFLSQRNLSAKNSSAKSSQARSR